MDGYSHASGNPYNRLKYSGKELDGEQGKLYRKQSFGISPEVIKRALGKEILPLDGFDKAEEFSAVIYTIYIISMREQMER